MVVWRDSNPSEVPKSVLFNHACRYELIDRNPKGSSAAASKDDRKALTLLSEVMAEDARPDIMLIVGENETRLYVGDRLSP